METTTLEEVKQTLTNIATKDDVDRISGVISQMDASLTKRLDLLESKLYDLENQNDSLHTELKRLKEENSSLRQQLDRSHRETSGGEFEVGVVQWVGYLNTCLLEVVRQVWSVPGAVRLPYKTNTENFCT
ncbi:hypothetical protein ACOMHN_044248 [Nucella lapillus]